MEVGIFCNICGKVFSTKKKLKQHEAYHDETEVECGECQEKFIGKGALKNHERKHKTSICPHCSVVLSYQNKLTIVRKLGTPIHQYRSKKMLTLHNSL